MFKCLRCEAPIRKPREATENLLVACGECGAEHRVRLSIEKNLRSFRYGLVPQQPMIDDDFERPSLTG